ncbi:uncharacterized protein TNCV_3979141 [Trichonephila clavipes]|nr:uncharacterized protein TNCV_3979141 [Trichonephila clavipes]
MAIYISRTVTLTAVSLGLGSSSGEAAVAEWYRYRIVACLVTSSSPVSLKTHRVGQRCTLNLPRAETSSRWCDVIVRRGRCQLRCRPRHLTMVQILRGPLPKALVNLNSETLTFNQSINRVLD